MSTGVTAVVQKVVEACQDESKRLDLIEIAKLPSEPAEEYAANVPGHHRDVPRRLLEKHLSKDFESLVLMLYKPRAQLLCELIRGHQGCRNR